MQPTRTARGRQVSTSRTLLGVILAAVLLVSLMTTGTSPASGEPTTHPGVVSDDPANWTPNVMDGRVNAVARIGDTIFVGGDFGSVEEPRGPERELVRNNLFAFDVVSRAVIDSFVPDIDGEVRSIVADPDTDTLYIGGDFREVNGSDSRSLAALEASTGADRAGFTAPALNAPVNDIQLVDGRLIIGGVFGWVGLTNRVALASLNAATGAVTNFLDASLTTTREGLTAILKMRVTPDRKTLIMVGNFTSAFGETRHQIAQVNLQDSPATLRDWRTSWYSASCSASFDTYMRDLDISADGDYFVVTTTGAYRSPPSPCDTQARFETITSGGDQEATWVAYTGGDTSYAVSITGPAVYVGGHFRWANNPFARDAEGPGAVPRPGLVALDPRNGIPLSWNPGRTRGVGVFDMLATEAGLWATSDTDRFNDERHGRIAYFPLDGGVTMPAEKVGTLPNDVYLLGTRTKVGDRLFSRWVNADGGPGQPSDAEQIVGDETWKNFRGAVMIDDVMFAGHKNGTFTRRTLTNGSFGPAEVLNLYGGDFEEDIPDIRGLAYDKTRGRLYYTLADKKSLYWRGFSPESGIVGAMRFRISGDANDLPGKRVGGMFLDGTTLYFGDRHNGRLKSVELTDGEAQGPVQFVNEEVNWSSYAAFISTEAPKSAPYSPPTAATLTPECTSLACTFDATPSTSTVGSLQYNWDFGDGTTGHGARPTHIYPSSGTYTASLTVTDEIGPTSDPIEESVTVTGEPARVIVEARRSGDVLHVNVNPNVGSDHWRFRVQKKVDGEWDPRKLYTTQGATETRTINLKKGRYRVVVKKDHGYLSVTSSSVRLLK